MHRPFVCGVLSLTIGVVCVFWWLIELSIITV